MTPEPLDSENNITELTIGPDGRVYVFGASRHVLEVLETIGPNDQRLKALLHHVRELDNPKQATTEINQHQVSATKVVQ